MTTTTKRKITVEDIEYTWCIRGNCLESKASHITVFKENENGQILYIDPYPWDFEIGPHSVSLAIVFALSSGWKPCDKGAPVFLGYKENAFFVLPKGIKHTSEYKM